MNMLNSNPDRTQLKVNSNNLFCQVEFQERQLYKLTY